MDWSTLFDEIHPLPGASEAIMEEFVTSVLRPIAADEAREISQGQRNPFPKHDPLHASWQPFDAGRWVIPDRPLPASYLSLLRWSNGGEFCTGERWFQFFPALDPRHGVRAMMLAYHLPQYMPGALPIAFNGEGTLYLLDLRQPASNGEYPVVCARAGNLGWGPDAVWSIAATLEEACRGTDSVEDLRHNSR
jgi:hypothetical protein